MVFGGERSATSRVSSGVPQGSVLGPVLFLLYTADVLQITQRHGLKSHSYSDDIQLYCSGKAATEQIMNASMVACIEEIIGWMTANRLKLNTDKTQFIWHGTRVQLMKVDISSIELDGVNIPVSTEVRCLGVVLDGELTFALTHTIALQKLLLSTSAALVGSPSVDEECRKDAGARIHSKSNRLLQQCSESCLCSSSPTTAVRPSLCCTSDSENTEI